MAKIRLIEESSRSKRGLHIERKIALIVNRDGTTRKPSKSPGKAPTMYKIGEARYVEEELSEGEYAVQIRLVRGLWNNVQGYIIVYDWKGVPVFKAVYRKGKLRRSFGDLRYAKIVETAVYSIGLDKYVKRVNWKTGL
ncbi:MAG: hypothetical protein F7C07_02075 [Desulfurococcales archaeon]|nr:hypothetical protein [Desulfurococcales archaeon]